MPNKTVQRLATPTNPGTHRSRLTPKSRTTTSLSKVWSDVSCPFTKDQEEWKSEAVINLGDIASNPIVEFETLPREARRLVVDEHPRFSTIGVDPKSRCQNCDRLWCDARLSPVQPLSQRFMPGEPMPSCECPVCGAACHPATGGNALLASRALSTRASRSYSLVVRFDGTSGTNWARSHVRMEPSVRCGRLTNTIRCYAARLHRSSRSELFQMMIEMLCL
jgi:hypothetical protein